MNTVLFLTNLPPDSWSRHSPYVEFKNKINLKFKPIALQRMENVLVIAIDPNQFNDELKEFLHSSGVKYSTKDLITEHEFK